MKLDSLAALLLLRLADGLLSPRGGLVKPSTSTARFTDPRSVRFAVAQANADDEQVRSTRHLVPDFLFTAITGPLTQAAVVPTLPPSLLPIGRAAAAAHDAAASMNPLLQGVVTLAFYLVHMLVLSKHALAFPFQLLPNNRGQFQCIGRARAVSHAESPRSARSDYARVRSMD